MIGTRSSAGALQLEAGRRSRSPASAGRRKSMRLRRPCDSGFSNGIPFQPSTIRSEEAPMPSAKRPPLGVGQRRRLLGQQRRTALEDADDAGAEPHPLGPGRGQRERGEAVRPVGLAASRGRCSRPPPPARTCSACSGKRESPAAAAVSPQRWSAISGDPIEASRIGSPTDGLLPKLDRGTEAGRG